MEHLGDSFNTYCLCIIMLLRISGWQRSTYPMPKSYYQSVRYFMAYDKFCVIINQIHNFIEASISSNLSGASIFLVDVGMPR